MEFITGIFIAVVWILLLPLFRWMITFFHEMGHAMPALVFTDDKVEVFVGSYGDRERAVHFSFGRLTCYFNLQMMDWQIGMCIPHGKASSLAQWIIILGGPIASTIISGSILFLLINHSYSEGVLAIVVVLFLLSLLDLVVNLYPRETVFMHEDGSSVMSDGTQMLLLWRQRSYSSSFMEMYNDFENGNLNNVIERLENVILDSSIQKEYYHLLIDCYQKDQNHEKVIATYERMVDFYSLNTNDYKEIGLAYFYLKDYTECIRCLNEYLYNNFRDFEANSKRGIARMEQGSYEEAQRDFEAAISYSSRKNVVEPLAHRGYIKLKTGDLTGAGKDLQQALDLSEGSNNAQLYFYFGCYHEQKGDYNEALRNFELAKEAGFSHHGLEYKIYVAQEYIEGRSL